MEISLDVFRPHGDLQRTFLSYLLIYVCKCLQVAVGRRCMAYIPTWVGIHFISFGQGTHLSFSWLCTLSQPTERGIQFLAHHSVLSSQCECLTQHIILIRATSTGTSVDVVQTYEIQVGHIPQEKVYFNYDGCSATRYSKSNPIISTQIAPEEGSHLFYSSKSSIPSIHADYSSEI